MKKLTLSFLAMTIGGFLIAQPTLKFDSHRLLPGADNPMTICKFMDPGIAGDNAVWDFSDLLKVKEFTGYLSPNLKSAVFEGANTELVEFNTRFFFDITDKGMSQVGYASNDLKTVVKYTQPFEKMRFPFTFKDSYMTNFSGEYLYNNKKIGDVAGKGDVEADAWGTLKLPNNKVYENTIRVRTFKAYTIKYSETSSSSVEIVTYRWYNNTHRYPLLVLTKYTTSSGTNESTNYQAAYNNNAVSSASITQSIALQEHVTVYPNPAENVLYMNIYSENSAPVFLSIYDMSGKLLLEEKKNEISVGNNTLNLSAEVGLLKPGAYLLKIRKDNQSVVKEIAVSNK